MQVFSNFSEPCAETIIFIPVLHCHVVDSPLAWDEVTAASSVQHLWTSVLSTWPIRTGPGWVGNCPLLSAFVIYLICFSIPHVLSSAILKTFGALFSMWFARIKLSSPRTQRWRTSSVTTVAASAAMVIKVEGLLYENVGLSGVTAWVAEKAPSLKPARTKKLRYYACPDTLSIWTFVVLQALWI